MEKRTTDGDSPRIVAETGAYLVAYKPAGMHSAPAPGRGSPDRGPAEGPADSSPPSLYDWALTIRPELAEVVGRARGEGGLIHRLDRDTRGLVLFAKTEEAFGSFERAAAAGAFIKEYELRAHSDGPGLEGSRPLLAWPGLFAPDHDETSAAALAAARSWARAAGRARGHAAADSLPGLVIRSHFRPFGPGAARVAAALRPASHKQWTDAPYATKILACSVELGEGPALIAARVSLSRGFRHQIRAHFAWLGLPLVNDPLYGDEGVGMAEGAAGGELLENAPMRDRRLGLVAAALSFPDPADGSTARYTLV
mgnify:CR=1 FL=1